MTRTTLPTAHEIRAACLTATLLTYPETQLSEARQSYRRSTTTGRFAASDLAEGERLLCEIGLISQGDAVLEVREEIGHLASLHLETAAALVATLILERRPPAWLRGVAGGDVVQPELIPDEAARALEDIFVDRARREAMLLAAARRYDAGLLQALGAAGEEHVVDKCREELVSAGRSDLADQVARVSLVADTLGYDVVAPKLNGEMRRLEVKATRRFHWRGEVFLSRNEIGTGLADPDWALVVCELDDNDVPRIAGWCRAGPLEPLLPADRHAHGRWVRASLLQTDALLAEGLPPV